MANLFNVFDLDKDGKWNDQEALLFVSWQNNKPDLKDPDNEHGEMVGMTRTLFARLHPEAESAKVDTARVFIDFVLHHGGKKEAKSAHEPVSFADFTFGEAPPEETGSPFRSTWTTDDPFGDSTAHRVDPQPEVETSAAVKFEAGLATGRLVKRRKTVSSERFKDEELDDFKPVVVEKSPAAVATLTSVLQSHDLFSHLDAPELAVTVSAMQEIERQPGDVLFDPDDGEPGDLFYVVGEGGINLSKKAASPCGSTKTSVTTTLGPGYSCNEVMLLYPEYPTCLGVVAGPKAATLYTLDRHTYRCVLSQASKRKREMYEGFLQRISFLRCLNRQELLNLADALKSVTFAQGEPLIKYGDPAKAFFLIVEGVVEVIGRTPDGQKTKVCEFTVGDNIGELEFLHGHRCVADCVAKTSVVRAAKMNANHFEKLMGPAKELLARTAEESEVYTYYRSAVAAMKGSGVPEQPRGAFVPPPQPTVADISSLVRRMVDRIKEESNGDNTEAAASVRAILAHPSVQKVLIADDPLWKVILRADTPASGNSPVRRH